MREFWVQFSECIAALNCYQECCEIGIGCQEKEIGKKIPRYRNNKRGRFVQTDSFINIQCFMEYFFGKSVSSVVVIYI